MQAGSVEVDGQPLTQVNVKSLRACIGIVAQEPSLFGLTIKENIALGGPCVCVCVCVYVYVYVYVCMCV